GLFNLASFHPHVVHSQFVARDQVVQIEAERADVLHQLLGRFLKGHKDAGFVILRRAADEKLHRQQRLAAAGAAAHQRRPSFPHAAWLFGVRRLDAALGLWQRADPASEKTKAASSRTPKKASTPSFAAGVCYTRMSPPRPLAPIPSVRFIPFIVAVLVRAPGH